MRLSLQEEKVNSLKQLELPAEPSSDVDPSLICGIKIRCPDGSALNRNFHRDTATIQDVCNFFKVEKKHAAEINLLNSYPKKVLNTLEQMNMTLGQLNIGKKVAFIVSNK